MYVLQLYLVYIHMHTHTCARAVPINENEKPNLAASYRVQILPQYILSPSNK